uniref:Uncharacterized protein n=1 Tax=Arundo donax TaxID=35708 RepID=A0A0A8XUH5_ARUDO
MLLVRLNHLPAAGWNSLPLFLSQVVGASTATQRDPWAVIKQACSP